MISTTFLVALALCLSLFSSGGKRNVLPMRSSGLKVGTGLDLDGFSSSLDLMKTVGVFWFGEEASEGTSGHLEEVLSSEGSENVETWCKPMVGSRRLLRPNSTSVDDFLRFMIQELVCHGITTILPKAYPVSRSLFTSAC